MTQRSALFVFTLTALAAPTLAGPARWLELNVRLLEAGPYTLEDEIEFEVEVVNRGLRPVVFWNVLEFGRTLTFVVQGAEERLDMIVDHFEGPPPKAPTIVLSPGQRVSTRGRRGVHHLVTKPGQFVFSVKYWPPAEASLEGLSHDGWTRTSGALVGAAEFQVVDRARAPLQDDGAKE